MSNDTRERSLDILSSITPYRTLVDMVESLQSQVKQLQETIRLRKYNKTSSARRKSTINKGMKTKNKTKRRGNAISRRK
ncbi:MAG: hypothetical protein WBZ36_29365 [Candidatus Nitrosopolaris sp.]